MTESLLQAQWLGNSVLSWLLAALGALLGYIVVRVVLGLLTVRLAGVTARRPASPAWVATAVLKGTRGWLLLLLAVVVALTTLQFPPAWQKAWPQLAAVLVGLQVALWSSRLIVALLEHASHRDGGQHNAVLAGLLGWGAQAVVWTILLLAVLSNAGINVNALIASLGVGGIAVALAAQNILGDLFASLSIGLDKPFEVGQYIAFGDQSGTVTRVGIKSTRIRSLSGEEISLANTQLLQQLVHNYDRMDERRIAFGLRLALDTPQHVARHIVDEVAALIRSLEHVRFDRGHLTGFTDSALEYEFVYFVLDPGFAAYRDVQQQINFGILGLLEQYDARLAVPVRVMQQPGRDPGPALQETEQAAP